MKFSVPLDIGRKKPYNEIIPDNLLKVRIVI